MLRYLYFVIYQTSLRSYVSAVVTIYLYPSIPLITAAYADTVLFVNDINEVPKSVNFCVVLLY